MKDLKYSISLFVLLIILLYSCNNVDNKESIESFSEKITKGEVIKNDSMASKSNEIEYLFDLELMKTELDSFALSVKGTRFPFELKTDTIGEHSSYKDLWPFEKGIFELINPDSTELLVQHHLYIPKTKRILRLYLLELKYSNISKSNSFFKKLVERKYYKADLGGGYYLDYGLTGTTDYVVKLNENILWFNVSCQYSKDEFNQLIEIFNQNVKLPDSLEMIKCFCHEACE